MEFRPTMTTLLAGLLAERIKGWRTEIESEIPPPSVADLEAALCIAQEVGIGPALVILVVAMCERWCRVYRPVRIMIKEELTRLLSTLDYSPWHSSSENDHPSLLSRYVVDCLRERWDPEAAEPMSRGLQTILKAMIPALVRDMTGPVLVVGFTPLPKRQGPVPNSAPWVAAAALYAEARRHVGESRDSRPRDLAMALLWALLGREPDRTQFRQQRRDIQRLAPLLVDRMVPDLMEGLQSYPDPLKRVHSLLEMGRLDGLEEWGGLKLFGVATSRHSHLRPP